MQVISALWRWRAALPGCAGARAEGGSRHDRNSQFVTGLGASVSGMTHTERELAAFERAIDELDASEQLMRYAAESGTRMTVTLDCPPRIRGKVRAAIR